MKLAMCNGNAEIGSLINQNTVLNNIMNDEKKRVEFVNLWAKFLLNDFMGMLKKKKKTIREAPPTDSFKHYVIAHYYGQITRTELRKYVDNLI